MTSFAFEHYILNPSGLQLEFDSKDFTFCPFKLWMLAVVTTRVKSCGCNVVVAISSARNFSPH